jgi:hypothetical protein
LLGAHHAQQQRAGSGGRRGALERLHPDWKIVAVLRAALGLCLQSICISHALPSISGDCSQAENALAVTLRIVKLCGCGSKAGRKKDFFFEKKKQKTFAHCGLPRGSLGGPGATRKRQKFFGFFFKKELLSSLLPPQRSQ